MFSGPIEKEIIRTNKKRKKIAESKYFRLQPIDTIRCIASLL